MNAKNLHLNFPILPNTNNINKDLVASPFDGVRTKKKINLVAAYNLGLRNKRFMNTSLDFMPVPIKVFNNDQSQTFAPRKTQIPFNKPTKYRHSPSLGF